MKILKLLFVFLILVVSYSGFTNAYLSSSASSTSNTFTIGELGPQGDVVINEVMWMGSDTSSADQWIELYNTTSDSIDISNWRIENALQSGDTLIIGNGNTIPGDGYLLITRYPNGGSGDNSSLNILPDYIRSDMNLKNSSNGHLVLKDTDEIVIDEAKGDSWPDGTNDATKQSMQRKSMPGDGLLADNWYTCTSVGCQSGSFWKTADGNNYGTPGAVNISD